MSIFNVKNICEMVYLSVPELLSQRFQKLTLLAFSVAAKLANGSKAG